WVIIPLLVLLASCSRSLVSEIPVPETQPQTQTANPSPLDVPTLQVGELSLSQLSNRGCGMTLWRKDQRGDRFLLFNGLQPNAMSMLINGKLVQFDRIQSSGQAFYGQTTSQIFRSQDGTTTAQVNVSLGKLGEIESVAVKAGFIRVIKGNQEITIPVVGDAGC
ncbi:MAG TPA: hypothetical protein V6C57_09765, partial [Coleofasciculaceae cyanobacterium]